MRRQWVSGVALIVGCVCAAPAAAAPEAKVLYRDATLTSHVAGYPAPGTPPHATLASVTIHDDIYADRTSFKVTLTGPPPSSEEAHRLTVGIGQVNVNGECVLKGYASATSITWLEQPYTSDYYGYAFSRAGSAIDAKVFHGTVAPSPPSDEGFDCGGAVLDNHADDGTPYNFDTRVVSTDRMLGPLTSDAPGPGTSAAVGIRATRLVAKAGKVGIRVGCGPDASCRGRVTVARDRTRLGTARYEVAKGKSKTLRVTLTRKARRLLARNERMRVSVILTPSIGPKVVKRLMLRR